jgi:hypothetical protein
MSKRGAVEVAWFQAYPLRQGVGSRAMKELQAQAQADGIALTLYPWDKGRVSQAKLIKFYKQAGFKPATKGAKNMAWSPVGEATDSNVWPTTIRLGNYLNWHATEFEKADDYHDANDLIDAVEDLIDADIKPKIVTANPKALFATQDWLSNYGSDGSMFDEYDDLPVVYNKDNKAYILDGHHRVAKALKTNTPIKVYLFSKGTNINEGGWASTTTQNTVITPRTVVEIMEALKTFESSFNTWQAKQELDVEIKIGEYVEKTSGGGGFFGFPDQTNSDYEFKQFVKTINLNANGSFDFTFLTSSCSFSSGLFWFSIFALF